MTDKKISELAIVSYKDSLLIPVVDMMLDTGSQNVSVLASAFHGGPTGPMGPTGMSGAAIVGPTGATGPTGALGPGISDVPIIAMSPFTVNGDDILTIDVVDYGGTEGIWTSYYMPEATGADDSSSLWFATGNAEDGGTGELDIATGMTTGSGTSGPLYIYTGDAKGTGNSGNLVLNTGAAWVDGVTIGKSGDLVVRSGDALANESGAVSMGSGQIYNAPSSGGVVLSSGGVINGGNSGPVHIVSGDSISGSSGDVLLKVGAANGAGKQSGYIYLDVTGATNGAAPGNIIVSGLPIADPHVLNALWLDVAAGRVMKLSAG